MRTRYLVGLAVVLGFGLGAITVRTLHAQSSPPVYYIVEVERGYRVRGELIVGRLISGAADNTSDGGGPNGT